MGEPISVSQRDTSSRVVPPRSLRLISAECSEVHAAQCLGTPQDLTDAVAEEGHSAGRVVTVVTAPVAPSVSANGVLVAVVLRQGVIVSVKR
jgi:hypothetical protein